MQPNLLMPCEKRAFYLLSSFNGTPAPTAESVFYKVKTEALAKDLCDVLTTDFDAVNGWPKFHYVAAATLSPSDQEHFHTEFAKFEFVRNVICSNACPSTGSAPLPEEMKMRVQYAVRAQEREKDLRVKAMQNEALNMLLQFTQAYHKMLKYVIGCPDPVLDLKLNTSYRCMIKKLKTVLCDYECLRDFPVPFEPVVLNLCPDTLRNVTWKDVVSKVENFLSTVHEYVTSNGRYKPAPESAADCTRAIKMAAAYSKRMVKRAQKRKAQRVQKKVDAPQKSAGKESAAKGAAEWDPEMFHPLYSDWRAVEFNGKPIKLLKREKVKDFFRLLWNKGAKRRSKAIDVGKRFPKPSSLFVPGEIPARQRVGAAGNKVAVVSEEGERIHGVYKNAVGKVPPAKKGNGPAKYYLRAFKDSDAT